MADFLDEKRKEIDARLRELRPLVDEYNRLEKAAAALSGVGATQRPARARRRGSGSGGTITLVVAEAVLDADNDPGKQRRQ